ncbi:MAG: class I SAM-dependent methyltransferase [archaeon]
MSTIDTYNRTVSQYIKNTRNLQPVKELKKFMQLLPGGAEILDLGCGPGLDAYYLHRHGFAVTGIDLSDAMISSAAKSYPEIDFQLMDMANLAFADDSYDGIWANSSLLHLRKKDMPKAISGVARVLRKKGIFYISVKQGNGEGNIEDHRYRGLKKYFAHYTLPELEGYLKGFWIISSKTTKLDRYVTRPIIHIFAMKP